MSHHLDTVLTELDYLVNSLKMELDVAPTDIKAHKDLLRRIQKVAAAALQIPDEQWCHSVYPDEPTQAITIVDDEQEFEPEIEALRQQGWKIITVTQLAESVEKLAAQQSDSSES